MPDMHDYMGDFNITPDAFVNLNEYESVNDPKDTTHKHVLIQWEGGDIWLDMSSHGDHHCIDIRQMNSKGELKGQGVFTIVQGHRKALLDQPKPEFEAEFNVKGHGWEGGYVMTLLTDPDGEETHARKPDWGIG